MKQTKTLGSQSTLEWGGECGTKSILIVLLVFALFGLMFTSCKACKNKPPKHRNDITSTSTLAPTPSNSKPSDNTAPQKPEGNNKMSTDEELIPEHVAKELEENVEEKLQDALRGKQDFIKLGRFYGEQKVEAMEKSWNAALAAEKLVIKAKKNGIKVVPKKVAAKMAQIWSAAAYATAWQTAAVRGFANATEWAVEAVDEVEAEKMKKDAEESAGLAKRVQARKNRDTSNQVAMNAENDRVFGKDWDWKKVDGAVMADVTRAENAVARLKERLGLS